MIKNIWRTFLQAKTVVQCLTALQERDLDSAKQLYSQFEESPRSRHIALGGRIKMMEEDLEGAKVYFERAASVASRKKDKRNQYVLAYCSFYLSHMKNDGRHEELRSKALSLRPSRHLFNTLPLAPKNWDEKDVRERRSAW